MSKVSLGQATLRAIRRHPQKQALVTAIQVTFDGQTRWVPESVVHDDSEVHGGADLGKRGELVVQAWWAEKEGLT